MTGCMYFKRFSR